MVAYLLCPPALLRDVCPLPVVIFGNCHMSAVVYLEKRK